NPQKDPGPGRQSLQARPCVGGVQQSHVNLSGSPCISLQVTWRSTVISAITNSTAVFHPLPTQICQSKEVKLIPQGYPCCNCTGMIPQELGGQGQKSTREACDHPQGASWFPRCHGIDIMFQWLYPIAGIGARNHLVVVFETGSLTGLESPSS
ncbi:mCG145106, partial [Mus musculus]